MKNNFKKIFDLYNIKYAWLLLISMGIFLLSLYNEKINLSITPVIQLLTYGLAFLSAVVWSILNYIAHMKVNANYRRYDNIEAYVDNLILNKDEKLELKAYLEDFADDLVATDGKTKKEAVQIAINQFRVQEFSSMSKNSSVFDLPIHYYLIGYVLIAVCTFLLLAVLSSTLIRGSFWLLAFEFMIACYSVGFTGLFFLYKLFDAVISKKLNN